MLPIHFGPWQTVYGWFRELPRFLFQTAHDEALMLDRERAGRKARRGEAVGGGDRQPLCQASASWNRGFDASLLIAWQKMRRRLNALPRRSACR